MLTEKRRVETTRPVDSPLRSSYGLDVGCGLSIDADSNREPQQPPVRLVARLGLGRAMHPCDLGAYRGAPT
ncbi:hypothetical protein [Nocardioides plantarum]|uniref:hypothetical protein n=1 Tax=Nocardioides plantarum TaxID=29299 RepID=UPI0036113163